MKRQRRRKMGSHGEHDAKLNITSMMDIFIIILVFLLKVFSAQGQLVTPAEGLTIPTSTIENPAMESLSVKILADKILVEDEVVLNSEDYLKVLKDESKGVIKSLFDALSIHAKEARVVSEKVASSFSGEISIHGDKGIPYNLLTRVMYTCSKAGYPVMKLLVYREE